MSTSYVSDRPSMRAQWRYSLRKVQAPRKPEFEGYSLSSTSSRDSLSLRTSSTSATDVSDDDNCDEFEDLRVLSPAADIQRSWSSREKDFIREFANALREEPSLSGHKYMLRLRFASKSGESWRPCVLLLTQSTKTKLTLASYLLTGPPIIRRLAGSGLDIHIVHSSFGLSSSVEGTEEDTYEHGGFQAWVDHDMSFNGARLTVEHAVAGRISTAVAGGTLLVAGKPLLLTTHHPFELSEDDDGGYFEKEAGPMTSQTTHTIDGAISIYPEDIKDDEIRLDCADATLDSFTSCMDNAKTMRQSSTSHGSPMSNERRTFQHIFATVKDKLIRSSSKQDGTIATSAPQGASTSLSSQRGRTTCTSQSDLTPVKIVHTGASHDWSALELLSKDDKAASLLRRANQIGGHIIDSILEAEVCTSISVTLATPNGEVDGRLLPDTIFLHVGGRDLELHTVRLSKPLRRGTSGSWVTHCNQFCGMVIAISDDIPEAFMLPASVLIKEMENVCGTKVMLPTVLDVYQLEYGSNSSLTASSLMLNDSSGHPDCSEALLNLSSQSSTATDPALGPDPMLGVEEQGKYVSSPWILQHLFECEGSMQQMRKQSSNGATFLTSPSTEKDELVFESDRNSTGARANLVRSRAESEWDDHKDVIIKLWRDRSLRDVMEIMSRRYGFHPSVQQYKTQLKKWGISKICGADKAERVASRKLSRSPLVYGALAYAASMWLYSQKSIASPVPFNGETRVDFRVCEAMWHPAVTISSTLRPWVGFLEQPCLDHNEVTLRTLNSTSCYRPSQEPHRELKDWCSTEWSPTIDTLGTRLYNLWPLSALPTVRRDDEAIPIHEKTTNLLIQQKDHELQIRLLPAQIGTPPVIIEIHTFRSLRQVVPRGDTSRAITQEDIESTNIVVPDALSNCDCAGLSNFGISIRGPCGVTTSTNNSSQVWKETNWTHTTCLLGCVSSVVASRTVLLECVPVVVCAPAGCVSVTNGTLALIPFRKYLIHRDKECAKESAEIECSMGTIEMTMPRDRRKRLSADDVGIWILDNRIPDVSKILGFGVEAYLVWYETIPSFRAQDLTEPKSTIESEARYADWSLIRVQK